MNRAVRSNLVRLACLIALPLALAACGGKEADDKAKAAGEILPGSISDSMLPLDAVRSQPPLAPRTSAAKAGEAAEEGDAEAQASGDTGTATDAAATPAASPTARPTTAASPTAPAAQQ